MNQNPNGPNYNPNPYGSNPNNYPAPGGPPPSSSPSNPGYSPSTPNPPSWPGAIPDSPHSRYGPYDGPSSYAPPPPGPSPYTNPVTPLPPTMGADPYGQTQISQQQVSSPGYPPYPNVGPSPTLPPTPPSSSKKNQPTLIIALGIVVILVIGGSIFGVVAYNNNQNTMHTNATATAQGALTATAQINATNTAVANTYPFSNQLVLNDPMVDNSKGVSWDSNQSRGCFFSGSAYHVTQNKAGFYNTCMARNTDYANFTFETEMVIKSGGNTADGGLLFRGDASNSKFYRLAIDTTGFYFILVIVDTSGTGGNARMLKKGTAPSFASGLGQTNTLAIVARGNQFAFYVDQQLVTSFTDSTYTHGQIGFDADYGSSASDVLFTNAKVWALPS